RPLRPRQPGAGPDLAPGVPGDPVLERRGELAGVGDRPVYVRVPENRPADGHPLLGALFVVHGVMTPLSLVAVIRRCQGYQALSGLSGVVRPRAPRRGRPGRR